MLGRVSKFEINVRLYLKICLFSLAISVRNFLFFGKYAKYHDIASYCYHVGDVSFSDRRYADISLKRRNCRARAKQKCARNVLLLYMHKSLYTFYILVRKKLFQMDVNC